MLHKLTHLFGNWNGTNSLWLSPDEPARTSDSTLSISPAVKGKFVEVNYTWTESDHDQEGILLIGYESKRELTTAVWADSWHMGEKIMICQGTLTEDGAVDVRGHYQAPTGPDWGWRIVLQAVENELHFVMYNIWPNGKEDLAVKAIYSTFGDC